MAAQATEPGRITPTQPLILQTAGTTELSGPSFMLSAPSYNATAQVGPPFGLPPATPAPLNPPGITPPTPLDAAPGPFAPPMPPAIYQPDSNSQPMPPLTPGTERPSFGGASDLPAPNLDNSGRMPLDDIPNKKKPGARNLMSEDCEKGRADIKNTGLTQALGAQIVNLRYTGTGDLPFECTVEATNFNQRAWGCLTYTWKASALCHKPLYFEEMSLERYGHSWGPICDPVISAAHFFGTLPILPYKMGVDTPCECQYALGYYRPGNCAPYMIEPFPISPRGAAVEAGFVVGAAAVLP